MERRLYEAAVGGDEPTLNTLMEEDELILNRLSLTSLSETPLHIAALCGHLEIKSTSEAKDYSYHRVSLAWPLSSSLGFS